MPSDWSSLWLSLRYAGLASGLSLLVALPLAWLLAHRRFRGAAIVEAAAGLPLVLPPAVLVYYLLAQLGRWPLRFSWRAAVGVSAVYTVPLLLRLFRSAFAAVDRSFEKIASSLGAGEWRIFWRVTAPLAWRAFIGAILIAFVRALVDFGVTALVAGGGRQVGT